MPPKDKDTTEFGIEILETKLSRVEFLRSTQSEILNTIRLYSTRSDYTLEKCLQEITNSIQKKFAFYATTIFLIDEVSNELVLYVASGEREVMSHAKEFRIRLGDGLTGLAVKTGQTVCENDVESNPVFIRGPMTETRAELCVPLFVKNKVIGVLDVEDKVKDRFKKELVVLMEEVAINVSLLIETKMLYDELKRYSENLEQKLSDEMKKLREHEQRYQGLIENVQLPVLTIDLNGYILWANQHSAKFLELDDARLTGSNISKFVKKGNMFRIYSMLSNISEGKPIKIQQIQMHTANGDEKTVELVPSMIPGTGTNSNVTLGLILRDVTEKMIMERLKRNYLKTLEEEVRKRVSEIKDVQRASILAIATLAESIDNYTYGHLHRIRTYSRILAEEFKNHPNYKDIVTDEYIDLIYDLSPLHDIGKVAIKDAVLQKEDKLTAEEFKHMMDHTEIGANVLRLAGQLVHRESIFSIGEMIARFHHQKWDGTGYPPVEVNGEKRPLKGEEIPLCARIVSLADVYDALTSKRPYKAPYPHEVAKRMILEEKCKSFDPDLIDAFLAREQDFIKVHDQFQEMEPHEEFKLSARDTASQ